MTLENLTAAKPDRLSGLVKSDYQQAKKIDTVSFDELDTLLKKVSADFYLR